MDKKLLQLYKETCKKKKKIGDFWVPQNISDFISNYYSGPTIKKQLKSLCQNCRDEALTEHDNVLSFNNACLQTETLLLYGQEIIQLIYNGPSTHIRTYKRKSAGIHAHARAHAHAHAHARTHTHTQIINYLPQHNF
jgi:hypothetical protein